MLIITYSKILFFFALSFILGIGVASFFRFSLWLVLELFLLSLAYLIISRKNKRVVIFALCLFAFALGFIRPITSITPTAPPPIAGPARLINKVLPSPQSELLGGILFGGQQDLDYSWKQKMNLSGVRHITAVSGANIMLLSQIIIWLMLNLRVNRRYAYLAVIFLLWLYIALIGFPASGIRAGVMATLLLLAGFFGRQNHSQRTIVLAGSIMLAINPGLLRYDIGFQLSFLATLGLVFAAKPIAQFLREKFKFCDKLGLADFLALNLAALIFTLPLSIYYFGYFSPISILANLLISPAVCLIMIFGFLIVSFGYFSLFLAKTSATACYFLLSYLLLIIDFTAKTPLVGWRLFLPRLAVVACYGFLFFWVFRARKIKRNVL